MLAQFADEEDELLAGEVPLGCGGGDGGFGWGLGGEGLFALELYGYFAGLVEQLHELPEGQPV